MRASLFPGLILLLCMGCTKKDYGVCEEAPETLNITLKAPLNAEQTAFFSKNYLPCKQRNKKKDPKALYNVGVAVLYGLGTEKDPSKAFLWFKGAADKKHRGAQGVLADMFIQGVGVVKDPLIGQKYVEALAQRPQQL